MARWSAETLRETDTSLVSSASACLPVLLQRPHHLCTQWQLTLANQPISPRAVRHGTLTHGRVSGHYTRLSEHSDREATRERRPLLQRVAMELVADM